MAAERLISDQFPHRRNLIRVWVSPALAAAVVVAGWVAALAQTPSETPAPAEPNPKAVESDAPTPAAETPVPTASPTVVKPREEPAPELTPYAVLIRINAPLAAQVDDSFRDELPAKVATGIRAGMGQMWTTTI